MASRRPSTPSTSTPHTSDPSDPAQPARGSSTVDAGASSFDPQATVAHELARQRETLVRLGYAELLGVSRARLRAAVDALAPAVADLSLVPEPGHGAAVDGDHVPFVVVVDGGIDLHEAAALMTLGSRPARLMLTADEIPGFVPVEGVGVPAPSLGATSVYVLVGIDTGSEHRGVTPETARAVIEGRGRTALTIAEGVALVTHRPDMLRPNRCFSLLASRRGDQRVPAIWISEKAPKLGWCWDRNPHTWLGSASAASRLAL